MLHRKGWPSQIHFRCRKQVHGPLRPRDLERADRRPSKVLAMTCSKGAAFPRQVSASGVVQAADATPVRSATPLQRMTRRGGSFHNRALERLFIMHRQLRETDRPMTPSTLSCCQNRPGQTGVGTCRRTRWRECTLHAASSQQDKAQRTAVQHAMILCSLVLHTAAMARLSHAARQTEDGQVEQALGSPWP
jgi:hypothetical protein